MQPTLSLTEAVAGEVRAAMARKRRSANWLATELGVSDMYVSRRLSGHIPFDVADLERIAVLLDVSVGSLIAHPVSSAA
jgi:hypothetical protein